jgi:hypothetical protein
MCYVRVCVRALPYILKKGEDVKRKMVADERAELEKRPASNLGATNSEAMENTHFIHDKQVTN